MGDNIVYLHGKPQEIGHFLRFGNSGNRQFEQLLRSGKLKNDRVVIDAFSVSRLREVMPAIFDAGGELILDTNVAELSCIGKYSGIAKNAPWANPQSLLTLEDLGKNSNRDIIGQIARFAVENRFHMVNAPTHLIESTSDAAFGVDLDSVVRLRETLDAEGGQNIGINYPLVTKISTFNDSRQRQILVSSLRNIPLENIWFRISGFGADATATSLRNYIVAGFDFHELGKPLVADGVGGLAALATLAFGSVGGVCHGVGEMERFDSNSWLKEPKPKKEGFARAKRILVPSLDRSFTEKQLQELINIPNARRLMCCHDKHCCPLGFEDMIRNPKAHYLMQRVKEINELSKVPDNRRATHFLEKVLTPIERQARSISKLKIENESLKRLVFASENRIGKMHEVLENLQSFSDNSKRSLAPSRKSNGYINSANRENIR